MTNTSQYRSNFLKSNLFGYLCVIGATAIWSGNFIVARGLAHSIPPISLAFYRWLVAVLILMPFAIKPLRAEWHTLQQHKGYIALISVLGVSVFNTLIYYAGQTTTAINLSLISITAPMFILALSAVFLRERLRGQTIAGLLLVVVGILVLITRGHLLNLFQLTFVIGDAWMLLAAVAFSLYSILLKRKPFQVNMLAFQWSTFCVGLLFLAPFFVWEILTTGTTHFTLYAIGAILYIGIFASFVAFTLWNMALETIGATKTAMVYYTLPVFSAISAFFVLGESVGVLHGISILLILGGIALANWTRSTATPTVGD